MREDSIGGHVRPSAEAPTVPLALLRRDPSAGSALPPTLQLALQAAFGGVAQWRDDALALAARSAPGACVQLVFDARAGRLRHRPGPSAEGAVLLTLTIDGQVDGGRVEKGQMEEGQVEDGRADDGEAGADDAGIDGDALALRYRQAVEAASAGLAADAADVDGRLLLDVRRAAVHAQASTQLPGAVWRDPATIAAWAGEVLPAGSDREVVVYCVHGHEVSRAAALRLRAEGLRARYLRDGIDGWLAAGRALVAKPPTG